MKKLQILLMASLLTAFQCDEEINVANDTLFDSGIFGTWEILDQTINGVSDMTGACCDFIHFYPDSNQKDSKGNFTFEETSANIDGTFILDQANQTITFQINDRDDLVYEYSINASKDYVSFTFTENNAQIVQGWSML
ncbi:MAG: hypothetical protein KDC79_13025 [Cyclobacteriaceae bacterium]|nr:hypothetical protein [Cyclobacteriaceae bacterium]